MIHNRWWLLVLAAFGSALAAQVRDTSPVLRAMHEELARSLQVLKAQPTPPYFISYQITDVQSASVAGSFGAITASRERRRRHLDVDVRVGDYGFDNTHAVRGGFPDFAGFFDFTEGVAQIPIEDDPVAIRAALWYQTDRKYKRAVERLTRVRANAAIKVAAEDSSPDLSREPPETYTGVPVRLAVDRHLWEQKIRRYTAPFARSADIYDARATFEATLETRWYVNSEGSEIQTSQPVYRLHIAAFAKAADGMELPRYESFFALTPEALPDDRAVLQAVDRMIADLLALRRAPTIEPYTGPAILSGRASAVFFHEVFGHRIEGHRQKREEEGQTFKRKVNESVLPAGFSVYSDPTLRRVGATDLAGFYQYDDEGVRARRVPVVERGMLKTFLMSRSPIEGFARSNGHGRRQVGFTPVARQSNLIVEAVEPRTRAQLKQMLIEQVTRDHKPFGLLFDDIEGGFTITGRGFPNAFDVLPVMVYRVFPDGREELVRGVDFIGTPLTVFSRLAAADDHVEVFNGLCGAESGLVPVSAVSPGMLVSQVEVQKKVKSQERSPILAAPAGGGPGPAPASGEAVSRAMHDELARSMAELRLDTLPKPYFIAYRVDEIERAGAAATLGSLLHSDGGRARRLTVELRVGDYAFDNTNFMGLPTGRSRLVSGFGGLVQLPLDDDYGVIRRQLWLATDGAYKEAVEQLSQKRAALESRTRSDYVPDLSKEDVATVRDEVPAPPVERNAGESLVRSLSAVFRTAPDLYRTSVEWTAGTVRTWYVNSEGTSFVRTSPWTALSVRASTQATDGMSLTDVISTYGAVPADLPPRDALSGDVTQLVARLQKLRQAPRAETYNGPVLFEGQAASELVNQVLAPRLVASRRPVSDNPMFEGFATRFENPLLDQIGGRVLPKFLSVTDNPSNGPHPNRFLGGRRVDDDGVPERETKLVDHGILTTLLTTRVPVRGISRSTGSRRGDGPAVSNLLVTTDSGLTDAELKQRLLRLAAERGKAYGIIVRRIANPDLGAVDDPLAFMAEMSAEASGATRLAVTLAFKLFPDGHEELIRNADVSDFTIATFKQIVAASQSQTVYTAPFEGGRERFFGAFGGFIGGLFEGFEPGPAYTATYVVPSILLEDVSLTRPSGEAPKLPVASPPWVRIR